MLLAGIQPSANPGFPPKTCGNDGGAQDSLQGKSVNYFWTVMKDAKKFYYKAFAGRMTIARPDHCNCF